MAVHKKQRPWIFRAFLSERSFPASSLVELNGIEPSTYALRT